MNVRDWIVPYLKAHKYRMMAILLLSLLTIGSSCALLFTSGFLISKSSLRPDNILLVYVPIVLVRTFGIGRSVFRYSERLVSHDWILRILAKMRVRLYHMIEPHVGTSSLRYRTGEILGVLADDIEALQDLFLRTILPTVAAMLLYIVTVITLGYFSIPFAIMMGIYLFVLVVILPIFSLIHLRAVHTTYKKQKDTLYQYVTDGLLGISDWILSGYKRTFFKQYNHLEDQLDHSEQHTKVWSYYREFIAQIIVVLIIVTAIIFSTLLFHQHAIPGVMIAAFVLVIIPLSEAITPVSNAVEKFPRYEESLRRIASLEATLPEVTASTPYTASTTNVTIAVDNVTFQYEDTREEVLSDISFVAPQGKKIAMIGKSGAGKSTLLKQLQGLLSPTNGTVTLNGAQASDIRESIPELIAVLNQNPYLFNTSVANNLLLAKGDVTKADVDAVMKQVKLDALIDSLPDGYQTSMQETGQRFSGGERQRIALARILLQDTPIVILDEPTVGLDPITERDLLQTIFDTLENKTLIWVTHHLVGMEEMDEILFLQDGKITLRGSHEELLASSEHYRKLYALDHPRV